MCCVYDGRTEISNWIEYAYNKLRLGQNPPPPAPLTVAVRNLTPYGNDPVSPGHEKEELARNVVGSFATTGGFNLSTFDPEGNALPDEYKYDYFLYMQSGEELSCQAKPLVDRACEGAKGFNLTLYRRYKWDKEGGKQVGDRYDFTEECIDVLPGVPSLEAYGTLREDSGFYTLPTSMIDKLKPVVKSMNLHPPTITVGKHVQRWSGYSKMMRKRPATMPFNAFFVPKDLIKDIEFAQGFMEMIANFRLPRLNAS